MVPILLLDRSDILDSDMVGALHEYWGAYFCSETKCLTTLRVNKRPREKKVIRGGFQSEAVADIISVSAAGANIAHEDLPKSNTTLCTLIDMRTIAVLYDNVSICGPPQTYARPPTPVPSQT